MKQLTLKNNDTVIIRQAGKTDAKEIIELLNRICGESDFLTFGPGEFTMTIEQEENFLENILKQSNALFLAAEDNGKLIGTLTFSGGSRPRIAHTGEMSLCVLKEYWGNGVGTALIEYLIEWCRQTGIIKKINLRVRTDNASAIHVYRKLGFIESGMITRETQVGGVFYDNLLMGYTID